MTTEAQKFEGPLPDGWQGGEPVTKHWRGVFTHLYRVTRPCASCTGTISLDVTKKALQGFSKNTGLLLRSCPTCRETRRNGGVGSRGGKSRPQTEAVETAAPNDLETLRTANHVMKQELEGLYARDKALFAENQALKAKLATFELQGAMAAVNGREGVASTLTFPWRTP